MTQRFMTFALRSLVLVASLTLGSALNAQVLTGTNPIDGLQEVPPSGSAATGTVMCTLDLGTNLFTWDVSYSGLTPTAAHFHGPAVPGVNAGVKFSIGTANPNIGTTTLSAANAADVAAGLWYVNVHSAAKPGGEIRGQVLLSVATPLMSTSATVALALLVFAAGVFFLRRRLAPTV